MHRAIETRYAGYRFRSRLEARYAVLFDSLGIKWDYEPEGFELGGGKRYLPDFWLHWPDKPGWGYWVEIKALAPTPGEVDRMKLVCEQTGHHGWFMVGAPGSGTTFSETGNEPMPFFWCAPIRRCTTVEPNRTNVEQAIIAARSARFEFGEQGLRA